MSEFTRAAPGAGATVSPDWRALFQRAEDLARWSAEVAEAVASNLEHLADTYRRMADGARLQCTTARLLDHVARLEVQALHEREAAVWLRGLVKRSP